MWHDAVGFEDRLQLTRCGRVRSKDRVVDNFPNSKRKLKGREIKGSITKAGYKVVDLRKGTKASNKATGKVHLLHRLIAKTFIENPTGLGFVNHMDGDKLNNRVENLEWCTQKQNMEHAWRTGLCGSTKKPVIASHKGFGVWFPYMRSAVGFNPSLIHASIHGRQKAHRGYKWEYCPIPDQCEYRELQEQQER